MRVDISQDPRATHYCMYCGLVMKARDHWLCSVRDGDPCEPKRRRPAFRAAHVYDGCPACVARAGKEVAK